MNENTVSKPKPASAHRSVRLKGRLKVPGDKSISHRSFMLGALAEGITEIKGVLEGEDVFATARAMEQLGAWVERKGEQHWQIQGPGLGSLLPPASALDFGNAGTGVRLVMGIAGGHNFVTTFTGDASLCRRPMKRVLDPLRQMGVSILESASGDRLPVALRGTLNPIPITYQPPMASAQVKSVVLLCGLSSPGITTVIEPRATRDHTERMLKGMGADISVEEMITNGETGYKIALHGRPRLQGGSITIPGDPSSAAFVMAAAAICEGSEMTVENVMLNPHRTGFLTCLQEMGAPVKLHNQREVSGETVADIEVGYSALKAIDVPAARAVSMIDEYPILAVVASCAKGTTVMRELGELRAKESDRLATVEAGLKANGVEVEIINDDLYVHGTGSPPRGGGFVTTQMDHRIAMSFMVMGLASEQPVTVDDVAFVATSFPDFFELFARAGARFQ